MSTEQSVMDAVFFIMRAYGVVIIISFICASVIWGIVEILSRSQALADKQKAASKQASAKASPVSATPSVAVSTMKAETAADRNDSDIPEEHVAVIAAICAMMDVQPRVIRVDNSRRSGSWVVGGRNDHLTSHRPIKRR